MGLRGLDFARIFALLICRVTTPVPCAKLQSQSQLVTSASSATYLMIANVVLAFSFSAYHIDISVLFYIFCPELPFASYARYSSNKARRAEQRNPMTAGNLQCGGRAKRCSRQQSLMMFMTGFPQDNLLSQNSILAALAESKSTFMNVHLVHTDDP